MPAQAPNKQGSGNLSPAGSSSMVNLDAHSLNTSVSPQRNMHEAHALYNNRPENSGIRRDIMHNFIGANDNQANLEFNRNR